MNEIADILANPAFWSAVLRIATPLVFGTLGVLLCERAGVLHLGIEGIMVAGALGGWLAVYHGASLWAGMAVAAFGLGGFGYTMAAPVLLRRLGQGRMMQLAGAIAATGLGGIAASAGHPAAGIAGAFALGLGFFMLHNSIQVRVTEVAPQARGSAVALHAFCFFMGQSLGPALYGTGLGMAGRGATLAAGAVGVLAIGAWLGSMKPAARRAA